MRLLALSTQLRLWSVSQRRARRTARFALHFDPLENRQLLSTGNTGLAAGVPVNPAGASAQFAPPPAVSAVAVSSDASIASLASQFGSSGALDSSQVAFLLNELAPIPVNLSAGTVATTAVLTTNPAINITGVNLTLTNLSVTVLNPDMTSTAAAITDEQVDSDAFLVPSTTEALEQSLGARTTPAVTLWNTKALMLSPPQAPSSAVNAPLGRNPVSRRGQSFGSEPDLNPWSSPSVDFVEPVEPVAPATVPRTQPAPQGEQAPAPGTAPQPAPQGGQAPPTGTAPQPAPKDAKAPPASAVPERPSPAVSDPDADAALDLMDARVMTCSRDGNALQPDNQRSDSDISRTFSVIFGAAVVASGGYRLAMREADRSQGRSVPRWSGSERPNRPKLGTPSR